MIRSTVTECEKRTESLRSTMNKYYSFMGFFFRAGSSIYEAPSHFQSIIYTRDQM